MLRFAVVGLIVLLCRGLPEHTCRAADPIAFQRWAILAAPDVRDANLSDLLTAELSKKSIELVEREQLDTVTREIELSKLLSADAASQRLQVGQLTKADALVLLSLVENAEKKKFLKLVISDCRYGSRLRLDHLPFAADRLEQLVQDMSSAVQETRTRFARGVERMIAVSPFLSKNLTHEFDHLQFGFAALLGQRLSERAGVAVLEIEEARAIGEELGRANDSVQRRTVPLFVEGEYEVLPAGAADAGRANGESDSDRPVRLSLKLRDVKTAREPLTHVAASQSAATTWLSDAVAERMFPEANRDPSANLLSREQEYSLLIRRAGVFAEFGAYAQSTALREAGLLLRPDDWEQRLALLTDYSRWQLLRSRETMRLGDPRNPEVRKRREEEMTKFAPIAKRHAEEVLSRGVLNLGEAGIVLCEWNRQWNPDIPSGMPLTESGKRR